MHLPYTANPAVDPTALPPEYHHVHSYNQGAEVQTPPSVHTKGQNWARGKPNPPFLSTPIILNTRNMCHIDVAEQA